MMPLMKEEAILGKLNRVFLFTRTTKKSSVCHDTECPHYAWQIAATVRDHYSTIYGVNHRTGHKVKNNTNS